MGSNSVVGALLAVLRRWRTKSATSEKEIPKRRHKRGCWLCGVSDATRFSTEYGWYQIERSSYGFAFARTSYLRLGETNVLLCAGCLEAEFGGRTRDATVEAYAWMMAKKELAAKWSTPLPNRPFNAFYPTAEEYYYGLRKKPEGRISKNHAIDAAYFAKSGIFFHGYAGAQHHGLSQIQLDYWLAPKLKDVDSWEWGPIRRPGY